MTNHASTVRLTASQAIVRYLVAQYSTRDGVSTRLIPGFVGIFGHGNTGGFGQAIGEHRKDAFFIEGRNEQGMAHIAAAFAKAARRDATLACTASIGPGSTNLIYFSCRPTVTRDASQAPSCRASKIPPRAICRSTIASDPSRASSTAS